MHCYPWIWNLSRPLESTEGKELLANENQRRDDDDSTILLRRSTAIRTDQFRPSHWNSIYLLLLVILIYANYLLLKFSCERRFFFFIMWFIFGVCFSSTCHSICRTWPCGRNIFIWLLRRAVNLWDTVSWFSQFALVTVKNWNFLWNIIYSLVSLPSPSAYALHSTLLCNFYFWG